MSRKALGRGLESLISGAGQREVRNIPLNKITPNPYQPRHSFKEAELAELSESIKENGIIQPIIVRRKENKYELIAGERRLRASQMAGLKEIPAIVKEINDEQMLQIAIVENVQREDLNPIDEARGYQMLIDNFKMKHNQVAQMVGKSRSHISNMMRILELSAKIQQSIAKGLISFGHAKVLLSLNNQKRMQYAEMIVSRGLSVRELEMASKQKAMEKKKKKTNKFAYIEDNLSKALNRKAELRYSKGKGKIMLSFYSDDDLNELLNILGVKSLD